MRPTLGSLNKPPIRKRKSPLSPVTDLFYMAAATFIKLLVYGLSAVGNALLAVANVIAAAVKGIIAPFTLFMSKFVRSTHHRAGSLFPFHIRENLEKMFLYSGVTRNPEETLGMTLIYSIIGPAAVGLGAIVYTGNYLLALGAAVASFVIVWLLLYMLLNFLVDKRTSSIERVLPDLLSMIAQNMSAGMTPYNALWVAARPEFGALADEIQKVARDTLTGTPLETALMNMGKRVDSNKLRRTVKLMIQGMRSGGELPTVLQEIARDTRVEQNLVKRMESETTAQVMFILFSLILGAPLLFAASSQFVRIFSLTFSKIDVDALGEQAGQGGMIKLQKMPITEDEFVMYAALVLSVCSFFGALIIGLMKSGKMTRGIPIIPVVWALAVGIFFLLRFVLGSFFGGMMAAGM
jgi:flagellar protein FlaJ